MLGRLGAAGHAEAQALLGGAARVPDALAQQVADVPAAVAVGQRLNMRFRVAVYAGKVDKARPAPCKALTRIVFRRGRHRFGLVLVIGRPGPLRGPSGAVRATVVLLARQPLLPAGVVLNSAVRTPALGRADRFPLAHRLIDELATHTAAELQILYELASRTDCEVRDINERFGNGGWEPIVLDVAVAQPPGD
mgnify:CR=1 FL=1